MSKKLRDTTDQAQRKSVEKLAKDIYEDPRIARAMGAKRGNSEEAARIAREVADKTQKKGGDRD